MSDRSPHIFRASAIREKAASFNHPWNPESEIEYTQLGIETGMKRTGVSLMRVPPGKESLVIHMHHREEEWQYILSGRGIAIIDGEEHPVGPGDFIGFPTPSASHNMRNPHDEDLVYLSGGEHLQYEIADFPDHGKRMVRMGEEMTVYELEEGKPLLREE